MISRKAGKPQPELEPVDDRDWLIAKMHKEFPIYWLGPRMERIADEILERIT